MNSKNSIPQIIFYKATANIRLAVLVILVLGSTFSLKPVWAAGELSGQETAIIAQTNAVRAQVGLPALTMDARLMRSAAAKANDMAIKGYFSHANPDGFRMAYWINNAGYIYILAGENLAKGFHDTSRLMNTWVASPSHYKNLVEPKFTNIGIGIAESWYEDQMTTFVVQHFGAEATPATQQAGQLSSAVTSLVAPLIESVAGATDEQASILSQTYPTPLSVDTPVITSPALKDLPKSPASLTEQAGTQVDTPAEALPVATWPVWVAAAIAGLVYLLDIELILLFRGKLIQGIRKAVSTRSK